MDHPTGNPAATDSSELELLQSGFRYALSLSHHQQDAEDLAQEAWVKLCERYGAVTSRATLFTTIRRLYIDRCRRARVVAFEPLEGGSNEPPGAEPPHPGTQQDLECLLGALRPAEREAIYLHHVEGRTAEEVGILTQQPRGTVLSLLHRAFKKLRSAAAAAD